MAEWLLKLNKPSVKNCLYLEYLLKTHDVEDGSVEDDCSNSVEDGSVLLYLGYGYTDIPTHPYRSSGE